MGMVKCNSTGERIIWILVVRLYVVRDIWLVAEVF